jgi:hypothetical protein
LVVLPGTYDINETGIPATTPPWHFDAVTCTNDNATPCVPGDDTTPVNNQTNSALVNDIVLGPGQTVTCTYRNVQDAQMPLRKRLPDGSLPVGQTFTFGLFAPGTSVANQPTGWPVPAVQVVVPPDALLPIALENGPFTGSVCELNLPATWSFVSWTVAITPFQGATVTTTYTNDGIANDTLVVFQPDGAGSNDYCIDLNIPQGTDSVVLTIVNTQPFEGCTPGYWKQDQHFGNWTAPYDPGDSFNTTFGLTAAQSGFANTFTLLDALNQGGGGDNKLVRHGVAALLNAASGGVNYSFSVAQVIALVQSGLTGTPEPEASQLAAANELNSCPLGRAELP